MIEIVNEYAQKFSKDLADTFKGEWIDKVREDYCNLEALLNKNYVF